MKARREPSVLASVGSTRDCMVTLLSGRDEVRIEERKEVSERQGHHVEICGGCGGRRLPTCRQFRQGCQIPLDLDSLLFFLKF